MERKIIPHYLYKSFGFAIDLINAPMMKSRGEWILDIEYNKLRKAVLMALVEKPSSLTGNEIDRFATSQCLWLY
jgi:hypothetical protein